MKKILIIIFLFNYLFIPPAICHGKFRVIHVFVALCDNENQGIVPVPAKLGNGTDIKNNLYWGALYGVKTYFKNSKDWTLLKAFPNHSEEILERCIFKNNNNPVIMIADAYDGSKIKQTIIDFLDAAAGKSKETVNINIDGKSIRFQIQGSSDLIAYIGHDGLMDFNLTSYPKKKNDAKRDVIILACYSKDFFSKAIRESGAQPILWTAGLMAPEAYTLKSAVDGWILNEGYEKIRTRAVNEYHKYQKCSLSAANNLFKTGW